MTIVTFRKSVSCGTLLGLTAGTLMKMRSRQWRMNWLHPNWIVITMTNQLRNRSAPGPPLRRCVALYRADTNSLMSRAHCTDICNVG